MLKIENLCTSYGIIEVLHDVSVEVKKGEIVSILGSNGAGKSTLLKAISGLMTPTKGLITFENILINGKEPSQIVSMGIVHIPEGRHIFPSMTVKENLLIGGYFENAQTNKNNMESIFEIFPVLRERLNESAGMLSGGEQQMLALGRGLMGSPKLLLLDEPSLGLAPKITSEIFEVVKNLAQQKEIGVLLVEQNAKKALEISQKGYILVNGRVALEGTSEELKNSPDVQKLYLGGKNV
ncbi:MAG: ABC transporter ATP-binding protein [Caldisericaceae bacterium]